MSGRTRVAEDKRTGMEMRYHAKTRTFFVAVGAAALWSGRSFATASWLYDLLVDTLSRCA